MRTLQVSRLGLVEYRQAWTLQEDLVAQRRTDLIPDQLLLLEHPPVITVGRSLGSSPAPGSSNGLPVIETSRGGQTTYHAPGQLIAYPILNLRQWQTDLHWYLRNLESVFIAVLAEVGVQAGIQPGYTGVWVGKKKIASIGVAVRGWVTYHGVALNATCDMSGFAMISPCGLTASDMTSLRELGVEVSVEDLISLVENAFKYAFDYDAVERLQASSPVSYDR